MQFGILFLFRIILDHFGLNFWAEQEVGRTSQIFWSFQISFPWTLLWYMTWPYLITPIFAYIQACTKFWGGEENDWNRSTLFLTYRNLISKGFLTAQNWNILNEDPFLVIFGPFLSTVETGWGRLRFFRSYSTPLVVGSHCIQYGDICLSSLAKKVEQIGGWMETHFWDSTSLEAENSNLECVSTFAKKWHKTVISFIKNFWLYSRTILIFIKSFCIHDYIN